LAGSYVGCTVYKTEEYNGIRKANNEKKKDLKRCGRFNLSFFVRRFVIQARVLMRKVMTETEVVVLRMCLFARKEVGTDVRPALSSVC